MVGRVRLHKMQQQKETKLIIEEVKSSTCPTRINHFNFFYQVENLLDTNDGISPVIFP